MGFQTLIRNFWQTANRGQGMVEFALTLPLLLLVLMGIVDFSRLLITYAAVSNGAREGTRYGLVGGLNSESSPNYLNCAAIRNAVKRSASALVTLTDADIVISYDHGDQSGVFGNCDAAPAVAAIAYGDRVVISVTTTYRAIMPIASNVIPAFPVTFISARTIIKGGVEFGPTTTAFPTNTPIPSATTVVGTPTFTPTATANGAPAPPTNFDATIQCSGGSNNNRVSASWTASTGPDVTGYRIYRTIPGPTALLATVGGTAANQFETLSDGTVAIYYVVAVNGAGEGSPSTTDVVFCGNTNTPTSTFTPSMTPTPTFTATSAITATAGPSPTRSRTPTPSKTLTPTPTPTPTATLSPSIIVIFVTTTSGTYPFKQDGNKPLYIKVYVYDQNNQPVTGATLTILAPISDGPLSDLGGGYYGDSGGPTPGRCWRTVNVNQSTTTVQAVKGALTSQVTRVAQEVASGGCP